MLVTGWDGAVRLPGSERPGRVWTAEPGEVLPGLRDLLGADAVLLRCLDEHEDPTLKFRRATLLAVHPERGWMVLEDLGQEVGWEAPAEVVEEVVRAYARMQVEAAGGRGHRRAGRHRRRDLALGGRGGSAQGRPAPDPVLL